jgi:RNase P subunit RPR2
MEAYCVRCKSKVYVRDAIEVMMKNNRPAISGLCAGCGTKVFKIMSKPAVVDDSWRKPVKLKYYDHYKEKNKI